MKKKYDAIIQIPTGTRYAYIQIATGGNADEIVKAYYDISEAYWKENKKRAPKKKES